MGLDVHVMPLSSYLSGQFQSPLEKILGSKVTRVGSAKPENEEDTVREYVRTLKERLVREAGAADAEWDETREPALGVQYTYQAYTDLRGFAAYQDYPKKEGWFSKKVVPFRIEEDPAKYSGLAGICGKGKSSAYPHLIIHADTDGYWVPVRFKQPLMLDRESYFVVGSSIVLLEELDRLGQILGMSRDWGELAEGIGAYADGDPLGSVKYGWSVLHYAARMSVQHRLPIIFDG